MTDVAGVIPWPFTTLWREAEWILCVGLAVVSGTAVILFALIHLDFRELTIF